MSSVSHRLLALVGLLSATVAFAGAHDKSERFCLQVSSSGIHSVPTAPTSAKPLVGVIRSGIWSLNDPARDGAREFEVMITVASLARQSPLVGLVGVGNKSGYLFLESERALERVALMGVPVVKVAEKGEASIDHDNLFIEAGRLAPEECEKVLAHCLAEYGTLPSVSNPFHPSEAEVSRLRSHLEKFQLAFIAAGTSTAVALR